MADDHAARWAWMREQTPVTRRYVYLNAGWSGPDGTPSEQAFACAAGNYAAAYRFTDAGLQRYFPARPDISNMGPLNKYDAFLILVTAPVSCIMPIVP